MTDMIGRTLSHFRIIRQLGAGGMGVVYLARDTRLDRDVAIKMLQKDRNTETSKRRMTLSIARSYRSRDAYCKHGNADGILGRDNYHRRAA